MRKKINLKIKQFFTILVFSSVIFVSCGISIIPPLILKEKDVDLFKRKEEYTSKELLDLLKKTISMTNEWFDKVNSLPELPETGYGFQKKVYEQIKDLAKIYIEEAAKVSDKDSKDNLFDK